MAPIVLVLVAPYAFGYAFLTRNLPTLGEQLARIRAGAPSASATPYGFPGTLWVAIAVQNLIVVPLITAALLRVLVGAFLGETWSATDALRAARSLIRPIVWALAMVTLATFGLEVVAATMMTLGRRAGSSDAVIAVGGLVSVVAWVVIFVLAFRLPFTGPAVVVEGKRGLAALRRSWRLSIGFFWKLVGNLLVLGLLSGVIVGLISLVPQEIARARDGAWWLLAGLGTTLSLGFVTPFLTSANTLLYLHCRVTKEALTLEQLEWEMAPSNPTGGSVLPPPPDR